MTRMSPWPRQHKCPSPSGQDRRLHLKTAELPRLTETMSLASPYSPNRGSSSQCQPTHEFHPGKGSSSRRLEPLPQHTKAASGVQQPSTLWLAVASTAYQNVAWLLCLARTHMNKSTRNPKEPPTPKQPNRDQPNMFLITLPGPGGSGVLKGQEGQFTMTTHPERFPPPGKYRVFRWLGPFPTHG